VESAGEKAEEAQKQEKEPPSSSLGGSASETKDLSASYLDSYFSDAGTLPALLAD
jgi:hypothetical protein